MRAAAETTVGAKLLLVIDRFANLPSIGTVLEI